MVVENSSLQGSEWRIDVCRCEMFNAMSCDVPRPGDILLHSVTFSLAFSTSAEQR